MSATAHCVGTLTHRGMGASEFDHWVYLGLWHWDLIMTRITLLLRAEPRSIRTADETTQARLRSLTPA